MKQRLAGRVEKVNSTLFPDAVRGDGPKAGLGFKYGEGSFHSNSKSGRRVYHEKDNFKVTTDPRCWKYAVCRCKLAKDEKSTQCAEDTCQKSPQWPLFCKPFPLGPRCEFGSKDKDSAYIDCEFAQ